MAKNPPPGERSTDRPTPGQRGDTRAPGYTYLPGGPAFQSPANMVKYLRDHPGYAWKHRGWLQSSAKREFGLAGYTVSKNGQMQQYEGSADSGPSRGKLVKAWLHDPKEAAALAKGSAHTQVFTTKQANAKAKAKPPANKVPADFTPKGPVGSVGAPPAVSDPTVRETQSSSGPVDLSQLFSSLTGATGKPLVAQGGAKLFDPSVAGDLADMQYGSQIKSAGLDVKRAPLTTDQNVHDINSWYGQVLDSQKTAGQRDAAISKAGVGSVQGSVQAILSAIGGQASEGAGLVGAAGADAVGTLGALGTAQDQYNADLAPLLKSEKAGAATREQAAGTTRAQDLALRLASLQGDRDKAQAGFKLQLDQDNNAILENRAGRNLQVQQANNAQTQQAFQNQLALASAKIGARASDVDIITKLASAGTPPKGPATSYPFAKAPVSQREDAYQQALASIFDGEGKKLRVPVPRAVQLVNQVLAGYGWSRKNPAVKAMRNQVLQAAGIRPDPHWR